MKKTKILATYKHCFKGWNTSAGFLCGKGVKRVFGLDKSCGEIVFEVGTRPRKDAIPIYVCVKRYLGYDNQWRIASASYTLSSTGSQMIAIVPLMGRWVMTHTQIFKKNSAGVYPNPDTQTIKLYVSAKPHKIGRTLT